MKKYISQSLRLTLIFLILLCVIYPVLIAVIAYFSSGQGEGEAIYKDGKKIGYANIGQNFTHTNYFWGRPSAIAYNAAGSGGSNKGATNVAYLQEVQNRVDTLLKYHPGLQKSDIPADMVTASGSGLDPDISVQGAIIQINRIASIRNLPAERIRQLVQEHISRPFLGIFGPTTINVLKLNIALDNLSR